MLKMKSLICTLLILALVALPALSEGFQIAEKDGKFALADDSGFLLTDYIYDFIQPDLSEPPFSVKRDGHKGFIDAAGNEVVDRIARRLARQTGAELLSLEVRSDNLRAKALYRKFGFRSFGTFPKYFKIGGNYYDVDCMTLDLTETDPGNGSGGTT